MGDVAYLHAKVGITHPAVDGEFFQRVTAVHFHGVEDSFGLEAGCFEGGARDVAALSVLCYAD